MTSKGFTAVFDWKYRQVLHPGFEDYSILPDAIETDYVPALQDEYFEVDDQEELAVDFDNASFEIMDDDEPLASPAGPTMLDSFGFPLASFGAGVETQPFGDVTETSFGTSTATSSPKKRTHYMDVLPEEVASIANHPGVILRTAAATDDSVRIIEVLRQHENADGLLQGDDQTAELPPLHIAAGTSSLAALETLLAQGANPKQTTARYHNTPLHIAVERGSIDVVRALLDSGADPKLKNKAGFLPLHVACDRGDIEIINLLLELHPRAATDNHNEQSWTPAHAAARGGHVAGVQKLLQVESVDPDATDACERTPLHWAAYVGSLESVSALVEEGHAQLEPMDSEYSTPESVARRFDHAQVAAYLAQATYDAAHAPAPPTPPPQDFLSQSTYYQPPMFATGERHEVELLDLAAVDVVTTVPYYLPPAYHIPNPEVTEDKFVSMTPAVMAAPVLMSDEGQYGTVDEPYDMVQTIPGTTQPSVHLGRDTVDDVSHLLELHVMCCLFWDRLLSCSIPMRVCLIVLLYTNACVL